MSRKLFSISAVATLLGSSAIADVPNVSVDIAPLHSLVASVMHGVGVPNLIIPPGSSPHDHQLRPSEAKAMQDANIVFWMGEELTPWTVSYTHLRAHETDSYPVCRLLLEKTRI